MGKPSPEEKVRNKNLVRDYLSGKFTLVELVTKYRITATRIYQIINRDREKYSTI